MTLPTLIPWLTGGRCSCEINSEVSSKERLLTAHGVDGRWPFPIPRPCASDPGKLRYQENASEGCVELSICPIPQYVRW